MAMDRTKLSAQSTNGAINIYTYSSEDTKAVISDFTGYGWGEMKADTTIAAGTVVFYTAEINTSTPDMGVILVYGIGSGA